MDMIKYLSKITETCSVLLSEPVSHMYLFIGYWNFSRETWWSITNSCTRKGTTWTWQIMG